MRKLQGLRYINRKKRIRKTAHRLIAMRLMGSLLFPEYIKRALEIFR